MKKLFVITSKLLKIIGLVVIGFGIGFVVSRVPHTICYKAYKLISADSACGSKPVIKKTGYAETQAIITQFLDQEKTAGKLSHGAMYFRDLKDGPVFGVNELEDFIPASLLKLPIAMAYLEEAERNPQILTTKLTYQGEQSTKDLLPMSKSPEPLEVGHDYTIQELLEFMIKHSDNGAYETLEEYQFKTRPGNLEEVYLELGIIAPTDFLSEVISVRRYSSLFRILYNTAYLNPNLSEMLLSWLAESDFDKGLVAGVPAGIKVANKFGERAIQNGIHQLHDCGIIYYPNNPYLLCVMTEGRDFNELSAVIATISQTVYRAVDANRL